MCILRTSATRGSPLNVKAKLKLIHYLPHYLPTDHMQVILP